MSPYGTSDEEVDGTGCRIAGIEATFSAIRLPTTPSGLLDIQIESFPPGDYIYQAEIPIDAFIGLIEEYRQPQDRWRPERWMEK